jgi:hypothetical protein
VHRSVENDMAAYISSHFFRLPLVRFGFDELSKAFIAADSMVFLRTDTSRTALPSS